MDVHSQSKVQVAAHTIEIDPAKSASRKRQFYEIVKAYSILSFWPPSKDRLRFTPPFLSNSEGRGQRSPQRECPLFPENHKQQSYLFWQAANLLRGCDRGLGHREDSIQQAEDVLYSGDHVLLEPEDYLEHGDHLPDHTENNLKACDRLLHLPNQGCLHKDYGRRQQEDLLHPSDHLLRP
jgi:hypothetical protein